jgi:hypothetical protein
MLLVLQQVLNNLIDRPVAPLVGLVTIPFVVKLKVLLILLEVRNRIC